MHYQLIFRFIGIVITFLGVSMIIPLVTSLYYHDESIKPFIYSIIISLVMGSLLYFFSKKEKEDQLSHRDGVAIVTFGWLAAGLIGAIPFLFSQTIPNFTDSYFESLSGFTTTGATILKDIENLPHGILLLRSILRHFHLAVMLCDNLCTSR